MVKERHPVAFLVGAAVGGLIGGLYALRTAPRPGAETWARLTERWHDVEERTTEGIAKFDIEVHDHVSSNQPPAERAAVSLTIDGIERS
jgi:gas vesicle protein